MIVKDDNISLMMYQCQYINDNIPMIKCWFFEKGDKYTQVNLTNHCYWNFNKRKSIKIFNHDLKINSSFYLPVDKQNIPLGFKKKVLNNDYDFLKFSNLGYKTSFGNKPYDINYITGSRKKHFVACLVNKTSKINFSRLVFRNTTFSKFT